MLRDAHVPEDRWQLERAADVRYSRQAYELTVPLSRGPVTAEAVARLARSFHERHRATYGHASPDEPVQLVNLRLTAIGRLGALDLARRAGPTSAGGPQKPKTRAVYFRETGVAACDVVPWESLGPGSERPGPVIVEANDTTVVVPPPWRLRVDARGLIVLERRDA
jgi:N-methylhydantoinase A